MPAPAHTIALAIAVSGLLAAQQGGLPTGAFQDTAPRKRMSFHNRLLLNRAVVNQERTIEVMLALRIGADSAPVLRAPVVRVRHAVDAVGYARVEVPTERLISLVDHPAVEAYQIASGSRSAWYRDGETRNIAQTYRDFELAGIYPPVEDAAIHRLRLLTAGQASGPGYTADDDTGLGAWMQKHPTFDGRGVTIAVMENGVPDFRPSTLGTAKDLAGNDVPKLAGVFNTIALDEPDYTRVELDVKVRAATTWYWIKDRTYTLPRAGEYSFGLYTLPAAVNLVHRFGVLRDDTTGEIRVDTDGDTDFQDERPMADINERLDPGVLKLTHPRPLELTFVTGRGPTLRVAYVYVSRGDHQTMTMSVAAGSRHAGRLAYGVAPGARVLLVRKEQADYRLHRLLEGYLATAARPDVDLLLDASSLSPVPDTAADFVGLIFSRMIAVYGKPVFHSAHNLQSWMNSVSAAGDAFAVGGTMGPATFAALYGGPRLPGLMVHPVGAAGPSVDGAVEPDFLAPMHRLSAGLGASPALRLPRLSPAVRLPRDYQISCCTSASGPYAGGLGAVLLSAARQQGLSPSWTDQARALRIGATFLPGFQAHLQGNGVLNIESAWRELNRKVAVPRIRAISTIVHPLAPYAARGTEGSGLFEFTGWQPGDRGTRVLRLRRESGPPSAILYRVSWTGNDGAFGAPDSIALPLDREVPLTLNISPKSPGAHSALLNLHDPATDAIVFRSMATIVAAVAPNPDNGVVRISSTVPLMRKNAHYVSVPAGVMAMSIELTVSRGAVTTSIVPSHSVPPLSHDHVVPQISRAFTKGQYVVTLPNPGPGTWTIDVANMTARSEPDLTLVSTESAEYSMVVTMLATELQPRPAASNTVSVEVTNRGGEIREPVIRVSAGTRRSRQGRFLSTGLPNLLDIDVPAGADDLVVELRADDDSPQGAELYLYDCTTGQCFAHDFTLPAARTKRMVVRQPKSGRWIAAVNPAPLPWSPGGFVLDDVVTTADGRRSATHQGSLPSGARWIHTIERGEVKSGAPGTEPVLVHELLDAARDRDAARLLWESRKRNSNLRNAPDAAGFAVVTLK